MSELTDDRDVTPENGWVLIKRGLYWRPKAQGYTGILSQAGLYSDEESAARLDEGVTRQRFTEAAEVAGATFIDIACEYWREQTLALRAAASTSTEGAGVKGLEWGAWDAELDVKQAKSILGDYAVTLSIDDISGETWAAFRNGCVQIGIYVSEGEATAAAQADYEARIRSALNPPAPKVTTDEAEERG